jgi:hypothetical protein
LASRVKSSRSSRSTVFTNCLRPSISFSISLAE